VDPAGTASQDAIVPLEQLSDAQRRALPTLVIGGAMHSDNPGSRMLIINNGVYREGDQPAPGLVLEEIRLKSAVFRYQGQRYSVRY
jgi:general secretion pathway protein B